MASCFSLKKVQACCTRSSLPGVSIAQHALGVSRSAVSHFHGRQSPSETSSACGRLRAWPGGGSARRHGTGHRTVHTHACVACPEGWPLIALLLCTGGVAVILDARTRIGAAFSAPLLAMGCGIGLSSAGIIPTDCVVYDVVWQYVMPMGAACFLLETDFSRVGGSGAVLCAAFLLGAVGMVAGACAGYVLLKSSLGDEGKQLACCLCASYIGGSANFAAVAKIVGLSTAKIPAAMAVDNVAMAACLATLIGQSAKISGASPAASQEPNAGSDPLISSSSSRNSGSKSVGDNPSGDTSMIPASAPSVESISLTLAMASVSCALGAALANSLGLPNLSLAFMSVIATACAVLGSVLLGKPLHSSQPGSPQDGAQPTSLPKQQQRHRQMHMQRRAFFALPSLASRSSPYAGASQIGGALMAVFFSVIGASAGSLSAFARPETPTVFGFIMIMVGIHWAVLWVANKMLFNDLPKSALLLGSNACIGGPATAAGMAANKGWHSMVQPAMMCGSLGYGIGTTAGLAVAYFVGLST